MATKRELYFSCDVEADGPIPGPNSLLSVGCAAFDSALLVQGPLGLSLPPDRCLVGSFSVNLETLPNAVGDPETMEWWRNQPEAWAAHRKDTVSPERAMRSFAAWVNDVCVGVGDVKPVFVGYPATYDFMFVHWYMMRFVGSDPFGHSGLDIKTFAMAKLKTPFRETTKRNMPKGWFGPGRHDHIAVHDAVEQGETFMRMLCDQ